MCVCCGEGEVKAAHEQPFKGPLKKRKCRDVIWLLLYTGFWVGMFVIAGFSIKYGEPSRLVRGTDSFGNLCGRDNTKAINDSNSGLDLSDRKYLFYFSFRDKSALKLCVPECPREDVSCDCSGDCSFCKQNLTVCLDSPDNTYSIHGASASSVATTAKDAANDGCPSKAYESSDLLKIRRCVPAEVSEFAQDFYETINQQGVLEKIFKDFVQARYRLLYCAVIAFVLAFVIILLMRLFTAPLIYSIVILATIGLLALVIFLWSTYFELKNNLDEVPKDQRYSADEDNVKLFLGFSITSSLLTVVYLVLLFVLFSRIRFVIALFEEGSKALGRIPQVILIPFLTALWMIGLFIYWVIVYAYLATTGTPEMNENGHVHYRKDEDYRKMWWYHLFGMLWGSQFMLACQAVTIAGAVATWYFTRDKSRISSPVRKSVWHVARYHLGSVALGSLLIALVKLARVILGYIQKKYGKNAGSLARFILACMACCLWCFEKCLKFMNKNAYIEIAVYGYSFCTAAREVFQLLFKNVLLVATINSLGAFVLFLCKLTVTVLTGLAGLYMLKEDDELHYWGFVLLAICVFAYLIASTFIGVYRMAIDTIFICFCEDRSRNDGSRERPYYMSKSLQKYMSREERRTAKEAERVQLLARNNDDSDEE
eukprot:m.88649 g.88649  ORF g.88649 m.88649 type:complete len:654 (+) comp21466_c0_seq2:211-2172(+)